MKIVVNTDGGSRGNPGHSACAFSMNTGDKLIEKGFYLGIMTNNQAEYYGLIKALEYIENELDINDIDITVFSDSQLMVNQINGTNRVKHENMKPLYEKVMIIKRQFNKFTIMYIPRKENKAPDDVLNNVLDKQIGKK